MKKERVFAVLGIVLPIIGVWLAWPYGTEAGGQMAREEIILRSVVAGICLVLYQLFYYGITLSLGVRETMKAPIVLSLVGLVLCIVLLISFFLLRDSTEAAGMRTVTLTLTILHLLYAPVFSVIMLIRSFGKHAG